MSEWQPISPFISPAERRGEVKTEVLGRQAIKLPEEYMDEPYEFTGFGD